MAKGSLIFPFNYIKEQLRQLKSSVTSISDTCDSLSKQHSPSLYTQWSDAGATSSNTSWVEMCGNLVIVHLHCVCIPHDKPTLISGLPIPNQLVTQLLGSENPSLITLTMAGTIVVSSAGTSEGVASRIAGTFMYFTDY